MSRHRVVINGTYTWSDDGPAVARTHGTANAWGTKTACVVGQMEPGRVSDLREAGYVIDCREDDEGVARYYLREPRPVLHGEQVGMGL